MARFQHLEGYAFVGCAVRTRSILGLWAQKNEVDDPLETNPTGLFFYYRDEPPRDRWACALGFDATGVHGCAAFAPKEQWVAVFDDGLVFTCGGGDEETEPKVSANKNAYFQNVKGIAHGKAYAVGPGRNVFRREAPGRWKKLDGGFPLASPTSAGFRDIDGFSGDEIYACGGEGDLWWYGNDVWKQIDLKTNAPLTHVCCAPDGFVYILTGRGTVLVGNRTKKRWNVVKQDLTASGYPRGLVWYGDRIVVATEEALFDIKGNAFTISEFKPPKMDGYADIAAGDGTLLLAGGKSAAYYDGRRWTKIA